MLKNTLAALAIFCLAAAAADAAFLIPDDFQDGTTQFWQHGGSSLNPPFVVPDGGPNGSGDAFLQVPSSGIPLVAVGRMVAFNLASWGGDYTALPQTLQFDAINLTDATDFFLRIGVCGGGGAFISSESFQISAADGWQTNQFSLAPDDWMGRASEP